LSHVLPPTHTSTLSLHDALPICIHKEFNGHPVNSARRDVVPAVSTGDTHHGFLRTNKAGGDTFGQCERLPLAGNLHDCSLAITGNQPYSLGTGVAFAQHPLLAVNLQQSTAACQHPYLDVHGGCALGNHQQEHHQVYWCLHHASQRELNK